MMHLGALFSALALLVGCVTTVLAAAPQCSGNCVRKEWRSLSQGEIDAWVSAVMKLQARDVPDGQLSAFDRGIIDPSQLSYKDFVAVHVVYQTYVHRTNLFYPFHRVMMLAWEQALQSTGYAGCQPYWDWTIDSETPFPKIKALRPTFGGGGSANGCVTDGAFYRNKFTAYRDVVYANTDFLRGVIDPTNPCLQRVPAESGGDGGTVFYSSDHAFGCFDGVANFVTFQDQTEGSYHSNVHFNVGGQGKGDMGDGSYSPDDPMFWLHHSQMDRYWWLWQSSCPSKFVHDKVGGVGFGTSDTLPYKSASDLDSMVSADDRDINDIIPYFHEYTVADTLDISKLCYSYAPSPNDLAVSQPQGCTDVLSSTPIPSPTSTAPPATPSPTQTNDPVMEDKWLIDVITLISTPGTDVGSNTTGSIRRRDGAGCPSELYYGWYSSNSQCLPESIILDGQNVSLASYLDNYFLLYLGPNLAKLVKSDHVYDYKGGHHEGRPGMVHVRAPSKNFTECDRDTSIPKPDRSNYPNDLLYPPFVYNSSVWESMGMDYNHLLTQNCDRIKFTDQVNKKRRAKGCPK